MRIEIFPENKRELDSKAINSQKLAITLCKLAKVSSF